MKPNPLTSDLLAMLGSVVARKSSEPRRPVLRRGSQALLPAPLAVALPGKNLQQTPAQVEADPLLLAIVIAFYCWLAYLLIKAECERSKITPPPKDSE
jgi:hypothetical protein